MSDPTPPPAASVPEPTPYASAPAGPKTNTLAIVSLFTGVAGMLFPFLLPLGAVIMGHIAHSQTKKYNQPGRGIAIAGFVLGYVGLVWGFIYLVVALVFGLGQWLFFQQIGNSSFTY